MTYSEIIPYFNDAVTISIPVVGGALTVFYSVNRITKNFREKQLPKTISSEYLQYNSISTDKFILKLLCQVGSVLLKLIIPASFMSHIILVGFLSYKIVNVESSIRITADDFCLYFFKTLIVVVWIYVIVFIAQLIILAITYFSCKYLQAFLDGVEFVAPNLSNPNAEEK